MAPSQRLSGMQKQVLGLYRGFLRAARLKAPEERQRIESVISLEFRQNAKNVDRKNFLYIEYLIRRGKKQLELLKSADTVGLATVKVSKRKTLKPFFIYLCLWYNFQIYVLFQIRCFTDLSVFLFVLWDPFIFWGNIQKGLLLHPDCKQVTIKDKIAGFFQTLSGNSACIRWLLLNWQDCKIWRTLPWSIPDL